MHIFFTIIIIIFALVAVIFILAYFVQKGYAVEREIIIDKPKQLVFDYIKHLKNQDYFSKWVMADPNMKKTYRGEDGHIGFVYAWDGNKQAGQGEQEIMNMKEGDSLDIEIRFVKPMAAIAQAPFVTESVNENQTLLKWGMASEMKYPMNILLLFMNMDKMLGKDMETSLVKLKNILEAK